MANLSPAQATVLAALISAAAAILICILNNRALNKKMVAEFARQSAEKEKADAVRDATLTMWMKSVDKKLDTHNGYAERFEEIGKDIAVIKNDVKTLYRKGA